ncbi:protein odr-4 homolog isoform X1 [Cajanus cajan]|uniref:Protein odr-4 isogeny n=1 Tax=Cajanus cajan TaxID=3821 RepID=A0A151RUP4_CAJCA|nr:protein odr-4 homolog isoform X1 [Cajanus cajan]KYP46249.1 Protein odr-4 isogeny [Cajanus cajan]
MAKAVVGEETRLSSTEDRLSQSALPSEVGLIIGKFSSALGRAFLFDLIPTPPNDSAEPASALTEPDKKKGPKSKSDSSSLFIDKDWVAEHARQVSRMLVGGMKVLGLYVWVGDAAFKNSTIMLCQTVKGVADAAPVSGVDWDERLLLHICYSPRRWNCRNCLLSSNITSSSLRPCDFKMGKVLASLQTFKCMHNFNLRLPILRDSKLQTMSDVLRHAIAIHAKELTSAKALIDGKLVTESESYSSDGVHEVELLLPFLNNSSIEACSQGDVVGILSFSGLICSFAYLNSKEPISQAVSDIKGDIITSLQSRLDIICDEVDVDSDNNHDVGSQASNEISAEKPVPQLVLHLLRKGCSLSFPRRVFAPWLGGVFVCDYLQPSETVEVLKDHCMELLSMKAPTDVSTILEPEKEVLSFKTKSFWDVAVPSYSEIHVMEGKSKLGGGGESSSSKTVKPGHINVVAAGLILLLSVLVGFVLFVLKG